MQRKFGRPHFGRGGGFRERGEFSKPINEGEEYDVEISEVGTKGDGIARVKNFVIFVPEAKQGEKCRIRIKMVRPRFAVGEKIEEKDIELTEPKKETLEEEKDREGQKLDETND